MKSRERTWVLVFGGLAVALIVAGVINHFANFIGVSAQAANNEAVAQLYEHDHPHFGVAMMIGIVIVAGVSIWLFRFLAKQKGLKSVA
jgi:heme/copper-type cytochrome/quinol oxidase subunit 2